MSGQVALLLQAPLPIEQQPILTVAGPEHFTAWLVFTLIKMIVLFTIYLVGVALLTLAERKIAGWIQDRLGPNRVGPGGLLQPAADRFTSAGPAAGVNGSGERER